MTNQNTITIGTVNQNRELTNATIIGGVWDGATIAPQWDNIQENSHFYNIVNLEGVEIYQTFLPESQTIKLA